MQSHLSSPATPQRSLSRKLASLSPLAMANDKEQVPCIMVTPSSPTREHRELPSELSFEPEKLGPVAFGWQPSQHSYSYGRTDVTNSWSTSKRVRTIIALIACLFFGLHLLVLPSSEHDVRFGAHHGAQMDEGHPDMGVDSGVAASLVGTWVPAVPAPAPTPTMSMDDLLSSMAF